VHGAAPILSGSRRWQRTLSGFSQRRRSQHISLERELVQRRALVTALSQAPAELIERVQRLERAIAVLHANLAAARHWVAMLLQEP
jgi:hypothetical protein